MGSDFLSGYWASSFPPAGIGIVGTFRWFWQQLAPLGVKPIGTGYGAWFWMAAAIGLATAPRYPLAFRMVFGLVPLSAFLLASIRLVPMSERLGLWFVPAVYVGVAMAAETAAALLRRPWTLQHWARLAAGAVAVSLWMALAVDVYQQGTIYIALRPYSSNHELDDRAAVAWLVRQRHPGDVWMAPYLTLPAIWWYAGADGSSPAVEASFEGGKASCGVRDLAGWVKSSGARRALVYLGFGADLPQGFVDTLIPRLTTFGSVAGYRTFQTGHALIVDFQTPSTGPIALDALTRPTEPGSQPRESGCITITPARRW
jgi:hypothetical protein